MTVSLSTEQKMEETELSPIPNVFYTKLWRLVNNSDIDAIVWNHQGDGIIVKTNSFKASNFLSFAHELELYGFEKSEGFNDDEPNVHYFHPNFKRNLPELIPLLETCNQKSKPSVKDTLKNYLTERWRDHHELYNKGGSTRDAIPHHGESFSDFKEVINHYRPLELTLV